MASDISSISQRFVIQLEAKRQSGIDIMQDTPMLDRIKNGAKYFKENLISNLDKVLDVAKIKVENKANAERIAQIRSDIASERRIKLVILAHVARAGFDMKSVQRKKNEAILAKESKKFSTVASEREELDAALRRMALKAARRK